MRNTPGIVQGLALPPPGEAKNRRKYRRELFFQRRSP
jgi:hypothetical protein